MKKIAKESGSVYCNQGAWEAFRDLLKVLNPSKIFVLVDQNTEKHCLGVFQNKSNITAFETLSIPSGEAHKTIDTCQNLWQDLSAKGADRQSILINIGGGVVTDLGGFVASTYQRGIPFVNIPTSLLAMVDASIGGKNGVDLDHLKNQIGIIRNPKAVIIVTQFLETLPSEEIRSGRAEMIKHGFISYEGYLRKSLSFKIEDKDITENLIWESILIKDTIISEDPHEKGRRKTLNYGHTLGHGIESYFLEHKEKKPLLHGEAIAIGMILETILSFQTQGFPEDVMRNYCQEIANHYPTPHLSEKDQEEIIKLLIFDKKNSHGKVRFVLLNAIGMPKIDCILPNEEIINAFKYYETYFTD